ncbi:DNA-directed RNA polymerase, mitochondrial [Pantherophis guttatus]|uniref:DNA-directed RNA polymerase n=1 Tax=Pantherophis guttatus TaxID=94885 RepID=A0A6P9C7B9_PANGU|nr:DNA-directed RNA polymerase, mitochondrial [Pantherophis guttatus]
MLNLQGPLRWGKGSLRVGMRCYSTRVKEESRKLWLHEQVELLEVLKARVKQLRADNEPDILKPKIEVCQIQKFSYFPGAQVQKTAAPQTSQGKPVVPTDEAAHVLKANAWKAKVKMEKQASKMKRWDVDTRTLEAILSSKTLVEKAVKGSPKSVRQPTADGSEAQSDCKMALTGIRVWDRNEPPVSSAVQASAEPVPMLNGRLLPEMKVFQDDIRMTILAYMDTSLFKGQKRKALQCLLYFHNTPGLKKFLTTQMFSLLMCHYAKQGALKKIGWLFSMLEENNLKPNQDCYMAVLNCMGRIKTEPHIISRCIEQLESEGFSLQSFFKDSTYEDNEVMMILKAIQTVKPDFQPEFFSPPTSTIPLLEKFYKKKKSVSYSKLNFTAEELQQRFRKQYNSETSDRVTVESVEATKPITATTIKAREILSKIRSQWEATLLHNLSKLKKQENIWRTSKLDVYPFLCVLTEKEYVDLMMQTVFSLPALGECVSILAKDLGTRIYNKYTILRKSCTISEDNFEKTYDSYVKLLASDNQVNHYLPREYWEKLRAEAGYSPSLISKQVIWPPSLLIQLGFQLIELMVQTLKLDNSLLPSLPKTSVIPVLYHVYSFRGTKQVEISRKKDAENGLRIAQVLDGHVTRKVVKQTVMTVVYGVTQYGGRLQIEKQLKEIENFPKEDVWQASKYLVRLVFQSLSEMFSGSREIQNWLTESAWLISKTGQTVEWVTPLGLPIIQPYHNKKSMLVKGDLQSLHLKSNYNVGQKPNTRKQKNAFPPNFIHSLDSSHMMLTALHCQKAGLTFVSVHDCFWTHAATVDLMNKICREQFVALHSQPILEDLSKFMLQKYCPKTTISENDIKKKSQQAVQARIQELKNLLPKIPKKGDFKLEKVKRSVYFFN